MIQSSLSLISKILSSEDYENELSHYNQKFLELSPELSPISLKQFLQNHESLGFKYSKTIGERIFKLIAENNPFFTIEQYLSFIQISKIESDQRPLLIFKFLSSDQKVISKKCFKDNVILIWKLKNYFAGNTKKPTIEDVENYFKTIDLNKDDKIDFEEFVVACMSRNCLIQWIEFFLFEVNFGIDEKLSFNRSKLDKLLKIFKFCRQVLDISLIDNEIHEFLDATPCDLSKNKVSNNFEEFGDFETNNWNAVKSCFFNSLEINNQELVRKINAVLIRLSKIDTDAYFFTDEDWESLEDVYKSNKYNCELILVVVLAILKSLYLPIETKKNSKIKISHILVFGEINDRKTFKVKVFYPLIFSKIREKFLLNINSYISAFSLEKITLQLIHTNFSSKVWIPSSGKSGSYFYFTENKKFIIKTIKDSELEVMSKILPDYYAYLESCSNTFISKIFGLYSLRPLQSPENTHNFIVMNNIFYEKYEIQSIFDIKGSTSGRTSDFNSLANSHFALRDCDFVRLGIKIKVNESDKELILNQILKDAEFLCTMEIMDYSLLIVIHHFDYLEHDKQCHTYNSFVSFDRQFIYTFGIIDFLTVYNLKKKFENFIKSPLLGHGISCVPPKQYAERFVNYIKTIFE